MSWNRFKQHYLNINELDFAIDTSRIDFGDNFFAEMDPRCKQHSPRCKRSKRGAISNPDEGRMVGHYWLRNAALAPNAEIGAEIEACLGQNQADRLRCAHWRNVKGANGAFKNLLVIGIGGSALGPQFVADALGGPKTDKIKLFFFDNTDPNGLDRTLEALDGELGQTLRRRNLQVRWHP